MADVSHISIPSYNIDGDINDTVARTTINNHVTDKNNPHNVTKAQIGLGNVDNTSDMDKPISTAVQNALDKKANNTLATESSPGLMSAEDKKAVDREFFKLVPRGATYVPHGADLRDDQYFKVGTYYHNVDVNHSEEITEETKIYGMPGSGLHESPLAGVPFIMYVMAPFSDKYDNESTANEMTLDRLRIMIVYSNSSDSTYGKGGGPIFFEGAFNRYGKDSGAAYEEGGLNPQNWFTGGWTAIATDIDTYFLKQYIDKHIYNKSNPHGVTKDQVGLGNVDNTADKDKSVNHANSAGYADAANHAYNAGYADTANHVSWGNVSGKPSTYPPSSHTHTKDQVGLGNVDNTADSAKSVKYAESAGTANSVAWDNVTGKPTTMASSVAWDDITDKPATYPPDAHTHTPAEVGLGNVDNTADKDKSVKYANTAGSVDSIAWDNVTEKPTTYPPSNHTHTPDQVGLGNVANLDQSKAIKSITRSGTIFTATALDGTTTTFTQQDSDTTSIPWENVTDKPATYPPSSHTHTPAEVGLSNVDNTADIDKPISTAVQKALNSKANNSVATSSTDGLMSKSDKAKLDSLEAGSNVESVNGKTGVVNLTKTDIGLGNVDNTADKDKSVKYAESAGSVDSIAWKNVMDKPSTYPPDAHMHAKDQVGLGNVDNTADKDKPVSTPVQNALNNKVTKNNTTDTIGLLNSLETEKTTPTDADYYISQHAGGGTTTTTYHRRPMSALWAFIKSKCDSIYATVSALNAHISNKSNPHGVTKAQVGLGNVDNTADSAKSVKYAASAGSANSVAWGNVSGKPSTYPPSSHTHSYLPLSGGTVTGKLTAAGRLIAPTNGGSWVSGKDVNNAVLGISTQAGSDGSRWDPIIAQRDYAGGTWNLGSIGNQVGFAGYYKNRTANGTDWYHYIQTTDGTVHFGAQVYANVSGSLSGKATNAGYADSAWSATRATKDSSGQQINTTYIKDVWFSNGSLTYRRGDGNTIQAVNAILDSVYPVGSIYMSMTYKSPASFIGGTWQQINNRFLFAAGSGYSIGANGGEYSHTLTVDEMPSHTHSISFYEDKGISPVGGGTDRKFGVINHTAASSTSATGGGMPHNNMPPYLVVYMWKRTA